MNRLSERYLEDFVVGQTFGSGRLHATVEVASGAGPVSVALRCSPRGHLRVTASESSPCGHAFWPTCSTPTKWRYRLDVASERYTDVSLPEASEGRVLEQKCVVGDAHDLLRRFQSP